MWSKLWIMTIAGILALPSLSYADRDDGEADDEVRGQGDEHRADQGSEHARSPRGEHTAPLFGLGDPSEGPFPSDFFTVADQTQNTCQRVNLPKPDCATAAIECVELDIINSLDGFNVKPRMAIPFDGPIDLSTATSENIFLVSMGNS